MRRTPSNPLGAAELRRRAKARLSTKLKSQPSEAEAQRTARDTQRLIQELQIHQIELEIQNEQLDQTRAETEAALERYADLYDFAPAAYFTLDRDGTIRQANLTGSKLFGVDRSRLVNRHFGLFVAENFRDVFRTFAEKVFASQSRETCEAMLVRTGKPPFYARIEARSSDNGQECRAVVLDITERRQAEEDRRLYQEYLEEQVQQRTAELAVTNERLRAEITERVSAEERLRQSEGRLAGIIGSAMDGIITVDQQQRIMVLNTAGEKMFGYRASEMLGQPLDRLIPERFRAGHARHIRKFERTHVTSRTMGALCTIFGLRANGQEFPIEAAISQIEVADQKLFTAILRDITERVRAEQTLQLQAKLFDQTYDAIYVWNLNGPITFWNRGAESLYGFSRKEAVGRVSHQLLRTKFADGFDAFMHLLEDRRSWEGELEQTTRDGQSIIVESSMVLVREAEHAFVLEISRDITGRKRSEQKIQEQANLLELAHDAIFVRSLDEKIQYWNKGAEQLYGWTAEEAIGLDLGKMAYEDRTQLKAAKKILLEKGAWSGEVQKRTKARREVVVASRWTLVRDGQGHPSSILVIDTDITEKKQLEAQFLRTQRLELIGTLAGGIAHDLNNILQVIITNLDLARSTTPFDERLPKYLDDAIQAANRAANLAKRLLTFSKGGAPIQQPLDIAEILTHAVLLTLSGSKLKPRFAFSRDLYPVIGDPVQLTQVIENVVINACEATPQKGKLLVRAENVDEAVSASSGLPAGQYVRIQIEDSGIGIPESVRDRIFEAFFTTKPGGSGLGLATVKSIIQQHGGSITIKSLVDLGTTVSLLLPATTQRPEPAVASLPSPMVKTTGRILVIDDEDMILSVVGSMLKTLGYECAVAQDGVEGCNAYIRAKADDSPFAAVLLDAIIPNGLSGEEALKLLLEADPNARVILCSGYADSDLFKKAEQLGFKAVLAKPFSVPEFVAVFNKVLS